MHFSEMQHLPFNYLSSSKFRPKVHKNVHFKPWQAFWHVLCLYLPIGLNSVDLPEPPQTGSPVWGEIYWRMPGIWTIVQSQLLYLLSICQSRLICHRCQLTINIKTAVINKYDCWLDTCSLFLVKWPLL